MNADTAIISFVFLSTTVRVCMQTAYIRLIVQYCLTFVSRPYLGIITIFPISRVSYNLRSSIGQCDSIFTACHIAIANCFMSIIIGRCHIIYRIWKIEWHTGFMVMLLMCSTIFIFIIILYSIVYMFVCLPFFFFCHMCVSDVFKYVTQEENNNKCRKKKFKYK